METNKNTTSPDQPTIESLAASEQFQQHCLQPTAASEQYWQKWLVENPQHQSIFEEAKALVQGLEEELSVSEEAIAAEWTVLKKQIDTKPFVQSQPIIKKLPFLQNPKIQLAAATILVFLAAFWIWTAIQPIPLQQVHTTFGETQNITLPDGSTVLLNANSQLEFAQDWRKAKKREVWLKGEGYFDVKSNTALPFSVYTEKAEVQVLGTSFNVWQRSNDFNVTLIEGKVQLALPNQSEKIDLKVGEQIHISNNTLQHTETADITTLTAWRSGKLIFKNATIRSIIQRLQDEYGWTIQVKRPALLERKVNASIQKNNPELLLEALREIYELDIRKLEEGKYEIR